MRNEDDKGPDYEIDLSDDDLDESEDIFEITPEDPLYEQIQEECEKSKNLLDRLQRMQAEFENYRKRMDARISEATKYASEDILLKVLDVYDNLQRATEIDFQMDPKSAKEGIEAIQKQLHSLLSKEGVRPIESLGKAFDPYYQHAVQRVSDLEKPDGIILDEYQKGYMLKEKVLRPAVVCVNRHEVQPADENKDENSTSDSVSNGD
ncbi:MAG: nucleotide exchange factor GrpE [Promethearchaeota archaeon]